MILSVADALLKILRVVRDGNTPILEHEARAEQERIHRLDQSLVDEVRNATALSAAAEHSPCR
jgi:hypothetical protein